MLAVVARAAVTLTFALAACGDGDGRGGSNVTRDLDAAAPDGAAVDEGGVLDGADAEAEASCPTDLPRACPSPAPSYAAEVLPILRDRCFGCHTGGGVGAGTLRLETYAQTRAARNDIASQVRTCMMPLADAGQPSDEERATLVGWVYCGAPQN